MYRKTFVFLLLCANCSTRTPRIEFHVPSTIRPRACQRPRRIPPACQRLRRIPPHSPASACPSPKRTEPNPEMKGSPPPVARGAGALSRSGWMPRGFASASTSSYHPTSGDGARGYSYGYSRQMPPQAAPFARLGPLPAFRNARSFYMRNGRGYQCDVDKTRMAADVRAE